MFCKILKPKKEIPRNYTEIIKLHGCVRNPAEGFVFSKTDYLSSHSHDSRFALLAQDIVAEPFIIVGSRFEEDHILMMIRRILDANKILKAQNKSFLISPDFSPRVVRNIRKINAEWIKGSAEDFLKVVADLKISRSKRIDLQIAYSGFININKEISKPKKDYNSKLYWGEQPKWEDVAHSIDIVNTEITPFVKNALDAHIGHITILGKRCSGKSTLLKRLDIICPKRVFQFGSILTIFLTGQAGVTT